VKWQSLNSAGRKSIHADRREVVQSIHVPAGAPQFFATRNQILGIHEWVVPNRIQSLEVPILSAGISIKS
jgi:hypothetical protein